MSTSETTAAQLTEQIAAVSAEIAALHERVRTLVTAADHVPAGNESEALALVDALADVRDHLRRTEEPLRLAAWHVGKLDVMPLSAAYTQGRAAGYAEAVAREREGDATSADDAATWFTAEPGQDDVGAYERGFLAGFAEYFDGRAQV